MVLQIELLGRLKLLLVFKNKLEKQLEFSDSRES